MFWEKILHFAVTTAELHQLAFVRCLCTSLDKVTLKFDALEYGWTSI